MSQLRSAGSWRERRDFVLQMLDHKDAAAVTRKTRLQLSKQAVSRGNMLEATELAVIGELGAISPKLSIITGQRLRNKGYVDLALLHLGAAVASASNLPQCREAIFKLGHCAKLAGRYGLAAECFAFTSRAQTDDQRWLQESQEEMRGAINALTRSFEAGSKPLDDQ